MVSETVLPWWGNGQQRSVMDHIGLVIIIKGTRLYAYKSLEQCILKMAYITEIKGYIWRIRGYILDCPFGLIAILLFWPSITFELCCSNQYMAIQFAAHLYQ